MCVGPALFDGQVRTAELFILTCVTSLVFVPHSELWDFTGGGSSIIDEEFSFFPPHSPSQALDLSSMFISRGSLPTVLS